MNDATHPVNELKAEHQIILRVIRALANGLDEFERSGDFPAGFFQKCVTFIRLFADACHHGKEEDLLFPVLESRGIPRDGGPIGVMLYEHQVGRKLTKEMAAALDALPSDGPSAKTKFVQNARQYVDLLTNHIFKEDNVLFNMGARIMSTDDRTTLERDFCSVNCKVFEGHRREQLHQLADEIEARWK